MRIHQKAIPFLLLLNNSYSEDGEDDPPDLLFLGVGQDVRQDGDDSEPKRKMIKGQTFQYFYLIALLVLRVLPKGRLVHAFSCRGVRACLKLGAGYFLRTPLLSAGLKFRKKFISHGRPDNSNGTQESFMFSVRGLRRRL